MRIDKITHTQEEQARLDELNKEKDRILLDLGTKTLEHRKRLEAGGDTEETRGQREQLGDRLVEIDTEVTRIMHTAVARYQNTHTKKELLADAKEIVDAITREDFLEFIKFQRLLFSQLPDPDAPELDEQAEPGEQTERDERQLASLKSYKQELRNYRAELEARTLENFENCYRFIVLSLKDQLDALAKYKRGKEEVNAYIEKHIGEWYEKPQGWVNFEIPDITFTYPKDHLQNLTKASSTIFDRKTQPEQLQQFTLDITPHKKNITTSFSVYVDMSAPELKGTENITEYDGSVFNSVVSVIKANQHGFFTAKQLATHLLYGDNPSNSQPSPQQIGAVTKSIEKQRHIDITIDYTEHAQLNKLPDGATYEVRGYMLPVEEHKVTMNGQEVKAYRLLGVPPLLQYANSVGQIGSHPVRMLNVPLNLDEQKIVIRDFLLREIAHIKNSPHHWGNTITLDRIIETAGEDPATVTRKKKSTILKTVRAMLDYWKQEDYIKTYRENIKAKSVQSFTIQTL